MPQIQVYRCPSCGANISFDGGTGITFTCQYCGTSIGLPAEMRATGATGGQDAAAAAPQPAGAEFYTPDPLTGYMLGGPALNSAVLDWLINMAYQQTGIWGPKDPMAYQRIANAVQKAMHELAAQNETTVSLPFLGADRNGPKNFQTQLTRAIVNELSRSGPKDFGESLRLKRGEFLDKKGV